MERQEIAALLRELLNLIRTLEASVKDESDGPILRAQQRAAHAVVACHKHLGDACYAGPLHYKTRTKLLRVVDQVDSLVTLCRVLAHATLPDPFDPQRLRGEIVAMCLSLAPMLEPVVDYYNRDRQDVARSSWSSPSSTEVEFDDQPLPDVSFSRSRNVEDGEMISGDKVELQFAARAMALALDDHIPRTKIGPTEVPVYFGTTRSPSGSPKAEPSERFLNGRGSGELTLGRALISIPPGHRVGELEQPLSIWKLRLKPNPEKHVVLRSVDPLNTKDWLFAVRGELDALPQRMAFVFIHGFNVTFSQAVMRAGQISRDISYQGLVTAFSWGSEATVDGYPADEDTVLLAVPRLVEFLAKLHTDAKVETFHIVAHSMGCRALLSALKETSWWSAPKTPVAEAVFAAPDVDAEQFRQTMKSIPGKADRCTLYGSERDWAIAVSRSIRKNHPRAGDGGQNILVVNGVETVDATEVGEHLFGLGHSYIADKRSILGDLWAVLRGLPMPRFGLQERLLQVGKYWVLMP